MARSPPAGLTKFDSAAVMVLALARFLHGRDFPATGQPRLLQYPTALVDYLPRTLRQRLFAVISASEAVAPEKAGEVSAAAIAAWLAGRYPPRRYPAVMIGSSSGALVHIAAALGVPWLPQTFLTLVRQRGVHPDDAAGAMQAGRRPAERYLSANPEVQLHHMDDPNQDRLVLDRATYFRPKFRRLPAAYRAFLATRLAPGGTVIIVECLRQWATTRLGDRHVFQFGALGGATPEEYAAGGVRVADFLARCGSPRRRWEPPPTDGETPEAEWGFEPALEDDILAFARERRFELVRLVLTEPDDPSPAVADLYRSWNRARGLSGKRLVIESFILIEPYLMLRTGSVPFWMKFNKEPSLTAAQRYLATAAPFEEIRLALFAHGVESIGLPPIAAWQTLLDRARVKGSFLGFDPAAYPAHFSTFARFAMDLGRIAERHPMPAPLPLDQVLRALAASAVARVETWRGGGWTAAYDGDLPSARREAP